MVAVSFLINEQDQGWQHERNIGVTEVLKRGNRRRDKVKGGDGSWPNIAPRLGGYIS